MCNCVERERALHIPELRGFQVRKYKKKCRHDTLSRIVVERVEGVGYKQEFDYLTVSLHLLPDSGVQVFRPKGNRITRIPVRVFFFKF